MSVDSEADQERLNLGHGGAGDDCLEQVVEYGGGGALAGAAYGTAEGCFIKPVPGSTTPMLLRALGCIFSRSVLIVIQKMEEERVDGIAGGAFATGACASAKIRDKDDHLNAAIGGALAGSIFGLKSRSWAVGLRLAVGIGVVMGAIKFSHGSYIPPFPGSQPAEDAQVREGE